MFFGSEFIDVIMENENVYKVRGLMDMVQKDDLIIEFSLKQIFRVVVENGIKNGIVVDYVVGMSIGKDIEIIELRYSRGLGEVENMLIDVERRNENSEVDISVGSNIISFVLE